MLSSQLSKAIRNLINSCVASHNWEPSEHDTPVMGFINALIGLPFFSDKWSTYEILNGMHLMLNSISEKIPDKHSLIGNDDINYFFEGFKVFYQESISDHWIIVPLPNTEIMKVLEFGDFVFLPRELNRKIKLKKISNLTQLSVEEIDKRATHTEKSRSKSFYNYTLLCFRVNHHSDWVERNALGIITTITAILRLLIHAEELENYNYLRNLVNLASSSEEPNHHLVIHRFGHQFWWAHRPLWTNDNNIGFLGNINWLVSQEYQEKFIKNLSFLLDKNHFSLIFHRSAMYFNRSILFQTGRKEIFEGTELEVLHLMIAAEGILLERESEKRLRLSVYLSRLVDLPETKSVDLYNAINNVYSRRSDYVHSANNLKRHAEDIKDFEKTLNLSRRSIAMLILLGQDFYNNLSPELNGEKILDKWYQKLNNIWIRVLSGE